MSEPFLGEIRAVSFGFAPNGWMKCEGQLLSISQHTALFSLLGTTYGGNGQTTFGLPDFRDRVALSFGQGPGLSNRDLGEVAGSATVTLLSSNMPAHTHTARGSSLKGNKTTPVGNSWAADASGKTMDYQTAPPNAPMENGILSPAGGSQPHNNLQPVLAITYIIAVSVGIFPSRS